MTEKKNIVNPWSPDRWAIPEKVLYFPMPKITIGILNYNRKEDLRRTLDCVTKAIQYPEIEIIVIDNASTDGSVPMIHEEFPTIIIIALEKNEGTSARNYFYQNATGKYIFSFDDDSFPATPFTILDAVTYLENHQECSALSFFCYQPITGLVETTELEKFRFSKSEKDGYEGLYFVEGGMCIRKSAWELIEGYDPEYFWGAEGADLVLQMYSRGLRTFYYPHIAVLHMKSAMNRNFEKNIYYFTRNYFWTIEKHFPFYASIPLVGLYFLRRLVGMMLHPNLSIAYLKGIRDGLLGMSRQRKKCSKLTFRQILGLNRWYLFLFRW